MKTFIQDPDAILTYTANWARYLGSDTLASSTWILEDGITNNSDTNDLTSASITISVTGAAGNEYKATNRITRTTSGETDDRSMTIRIKER